MAALATLSAVAAVVVVVWVGRRRRWMDFDRHWLPEASQKPRDFAGLAPQPPQTRQKAGGWQAGLKGTLTAPRPMAPYALI